MAIILSVHFQKISRLENFLKLCKIIVGTACTCDILLTFKNFTQFSTLQVKSILVAMATKILQLATKLEPKSPAWQLKLRRMIENVSLI